VLDAAAIARATRRMAHEILERDRNAERLALLAIPEGGIPVADLLATHLAELAGAPIARGVLDVTLYRDDVIGRGRRPLPKGTRIEFSVTGRRVILVEDVVFTGRTVRAAMDAVIDFGRPEAIEVATLVDRGHREFPIKVDYVGKNIPTSRAEQVVLRRNADGELEVAVV
jgi:pyrimidine operon attenuation protein/uracil phosphoribosyltransferase